MRNIMANDDDDHLKINKRYITGMLKMDLKF